MRALVAGGAGRLGSSLVERLLAEGHHVDVVDDLSSGSLDHLAEARADRSNSLKIHRHDIVDASTPVLVERLVPDTVFSVVAPPADATATRVVEVGVVGIVNLLEGAASLERSPKLVAALSASALYAGVPADRLPLREDAGASPVGPDGLAAQGCLAALDTYRRSAQVEFTALILSSVYGAPNLRSPHTRQDPVAALVRAAATGEWAVVEEPADAAHDLLHIDDATDALARAAERADGLVLHIGSGETTPLARIVSTLATLGRPVEVDYRAPIAPLPSVSLDPSRAGIHLGWTPYTPLVDGLRALLLHSGESHVK